MWNTAPRLPQLAAVVIMDVEEEVRGVKTFVLEATVRISCETKCQWLGILSNQCSEVSSCT